jgi:Family of unknown function (DUF6069)
MTVAKGADPGPAGRTVAGLLQFVRRHAATVFTVIAAITFVVRLIPDFTYIPTVDGVSNAETAVLVVMHAIAAAGNHARAHQRLEKFERGRRVHPVEHPPHCFAQYPLLLRLGYPIGAQDVIERLRPGDLHLISRLGLVAGPT